MFFNLQEEEKKMWQDNIRRVTPYTPGEQPKDKDVIKLNTNESPYPPSPMVQEVVRSVENNRNRLYPDPEAAVLTDAIAKYYNVDSNQVFVGVGSDDVIGMSFLTFFNSEKPILYLVENGGIIFPNPNAPTAVEMQLDDIEYIIKNNRDSVVIIDEAYADFGDVSVLGLVNKYENLLVVRTYSKSRALAGMRIGYAIGSRTLISALKAVKFSYNSYTMNYVSIYAGAAAINDDKYFKEIVSKVINTREKAKDTLKKLGFSFTDSKTNFLFATHKSVPAEEIFEELKKRKIYVRYFNKPRINNYLRITIGTDEEMEKLYEALKEIVK